MSEALRKACKVELENVRNLTDGYEEELDRLVAFVKRREATVYKSLADKYRGGPGLGANETLDAVVEYCEQHAKELE